MIPRFPARWRSRSSRCSSEEVDRVPITVCVIYVSLTRTFTITSKLMFVEPRRWRSNDYDATARHRRDAQLFHEQRDEPEAVPLLERPVDRVIRHGAPVPAVLVASDLSRLDVEVEDNGRRQREPDER